MEQVKVALLGFGTVGQGTFELLVKNCDLIANRTGVSIQVSKIFVRNAEKYSHITLPEGTQFTNDVDSIFEDPSIQIIVEVMGGITFARDCVEKALKAKKSVVTANKDLLAEAGPYLLDLAGKNGVDLRYEASVLGGIPIIRTLYESLGGNKITEIVGILNGTTNFILSNMTEKGAGYAEVLAEAQALGYAEADPTADVEGLDAARKLAILSSIAFNRRIFFEDVSVKSTLRILPLVKNSVTPLNYWALPKKRKKACPLMCIRPLFPAIIRSHRYAVPITLYMLRATASMTPCSMVAAPAACQRAVPS